jgi:hypothetical protein
MWVNIHFEEERKKRERMTHTNTNIHTHKRADCARETNKQRQVERQSGRGIDTEIGI